MCARRGSRRRSPEIQAGLETLKREMAKSLPPRSPAGEWSAAPSGALGPDRPSRWGDNGPMVSRLLDMAERQVSARRPFDRYTGPAANRPGPEAGDQPSPPPQP